MRKSASDSITAKVELAKRLETPIEVPNGLDGLTAKELMAWQQYTSARIKWNQPELRSIHRLIKHETQLARLIDEAAGIPLVYERPSGDIATHPIHTEVRNAHKLANELLRVLALNIPMNATTDVSTAPSGSTRGKKVSMLR